MCSVSFNLFSRNSEHMRNIIDLPGIKIGGHNINKKRYVDDIVLIAENKNDLARANSVRKKDLSLNLKKTETMIISKNSDIPNVILKVM